MAPGRPKAEPNKRQFRSRGYSETQESSRQVVGIGHNYWEEDPVTGLGSREPGIPWRGSGSLNQRDLLSNSGPDAD